MPDTAWWLAVGGGVSAAAFTFAWAIVASGAPRTPEAMAREADADWAAIQEQARRDREGKVTRIARKAKQPKVPESVFQQHVLELAAIRGWRSMHIRPAMNRSGRWRTPIAGDGKGFPDTVLVRGDRLIFAELKSDTGRTTREQEAWLADLRAVPGVEVYVWHPRDWDAIAGILS